MVLHSGGQSGGASQWRVCYQRGLPRLVQYPYALFHISDCTAESAKFSIHLVPQLREAVHGRGAGVEVDTDTGLSLEGVALNLVS